MHLKRVRSWCEKAKQNQLGRILRTHNGCFVDGERVVSQPGDFYGGWITSDLVGPFKGGAGTRGW
jgi:hypothetical protein